MHSNVDERDADIHRKETDEVGVSIIIQTKNILQHSKLSLQLGCDGTFHVAKSVPYDNMKFELNTSVLSDK